MVEFLRAHDHEFNKLRVYLGPPRLGADLQAAVVALDSASYGELGAARAACNSVLDAMEHHKWLVATLQMAADMTEDPGFARFLSSVAPLITVVSVRHLRISKVDVNFAAHDSSFSTEFRYELRLGGPGSVPSALVCRSSWELINEHGGSQMTAMQLRVRLSAELDGAVLFSAESSERRVDGSPDCHGGRPAPVRRGNLRDLEERLSAAAGCRAGPTGFKRLVAALMGGRPARCIALVLSGAKSFVASAKKPVDVCGFGFCFDPSAVVLLAALGRELFGRPHK